MPGKDSSLNDLHQSWQKNSSIMYLDTAFAPSLPVSPHFAKHSLTTRTSPSKTLQHVTRALAATLSTGHPVASSQQTAQPAHPLFFQSSSFAALGLDSVLLQYLSTQQISNPTGIQSRGIPPILGGADVILGAVTGSGKTLAYLLPVVQQLKHEEQLHQEGDPPVRVPHRPRAVILVPTRELADQVISVARALSHFAKFRVVGAVGGGAASTKKLNQRLSLPVDVLVSTTGRLSQMVKDRAIDLRFVSHVVVDEVDTMFDAGFGPELRKILDASRGGSSRVNSPQFVAVGATHPNSAKVIYEEVFPSAKQIDVDLHRPPPGLEQRFIQVEGSKKVQELVALMGEARADGSLRGGRMMVFCNTLDSVRFVDHFLREAGYQTGCIHGDVPSGIREEAYEYFRRGKSQVLVCSDMAARGLDNLAVEHVVLFDFPTSAVDYLHRAGRTARAGAKGRVTSFVTKRDLRLARAIEKAGSGGVDALESARIAREAEKTRRRREQEALREQQEMSQAQELSTEQFNRRGGGGKSDGRGKGGTGRRSGRRGGRRR